MIYPPLKVLQQWRDEGVKPEEIQGRCLEIQAKKACIICGGGVYKTKGYAVSIISRCIES